MASSWRSSWDLGPRLARCAPSPMPSSSSMETPRTFASLTDARHSYQIIHRYIESLSQAEQLFRAECDGVAFPVGLGSLGKSQSVSELLLRKACLLTQRVQTLDERSAFACGRSARFHERGISRQILRLEIIPSLLEVTLATRMNNAKLNERKAYEAPA